MNFFVMFLAGLIIVSLASYAGYLLYLLRQQSQREAQAKLEQLERRQKQQEQLRESIRIIASALVAEQCEIAEGAVRLAHLLRQVDRSTDWAIEFPHIAQLQEKIAHHPIGAARKGLAKQERMKLDMQRMKLEAEYCDTVLEEAKIIVKQFS